MKTLQLSIITGMGIAGMCIVLFFVFGVADNHPILSHNTYLGTTKINGTDFSVNYTLTNATKLGIAENPYKNKAFTIYLQTLGNGNASLTLPRALWGNGISNSSEPILYLERVVNGFNLIDYHVDKTTIKEVTFTFPFKKGDTHISLGIPDSKSMCCSRELK